MFCASAFALRIAIRVSRSGAEMSAIRPTRTRAQAVFQLRDRFRRPVARKNDLLAFLMDRVERVEELFLCSLFAGDELDIVDEQDIDASVALAELLAFCARIELMNSLVNFSLVAYTTRFFGWRAITA